MPCPSPSEVIEFLNGGGAPGAGVEIEEHVDGCGVCSALFAELARETASPRSTNAASVVARPAYFERGARVGRYVILYRLGAGGMGTVYAAYDTDLDRKVALKFLHLEGHASDAVEIHTRLLREAQAAARLSHPNVVPVFDRGSWEGRFFLAMEMVEGGTLTTWLAPRDRTWREVLLVFIEVGRGLAAAHAAGLVHGDFKPDNVLIGRDGRPRIADFGLATVAPRGRGDEEIDESAKVSSIPGGAGGTPEYMAPEQLAGAAADERSDQFAFCVALHEALFGARLSPEIDRPDKVRRERTSRAPAEVRRAVSRGLSPQPSQRFASMASLLGELERGLRRRHWGRWLAVAVVGILFAAVGIRLGQQRRQQCEPASVLADRLVGRQDLEAIDSAFAKSGTAGAASAARYVAKQLSAYAQAWANQSHQACTATWVNHSQSEEVLYLRMHCLASRANEARGLIQALSRAEASEVHHALEAVDGLTRLDACADVDALKAPVRMSPDPATRQKIANAEAEVTKVYTLGHMGKFPEGLSQAKVALEAAREASYPPLTAKAWLALSKMEDTRGDYTSSERSAQEAEWAAEEGRDDTLRAEALNRVAHVEGLHLDHYAEAHNWSRFAQAAIQRISHGEPEEIERLWTEGQVFAEEGHPKQAMEAMRSALGLSEKVGDAAGPQREWILQGLASACDAADDVDAALGYEKQALQVADARLGPDNYEDKQFLTDIAGLHQRKHEYEEAETALLKAKSIDEHLLGTDDFQLVFTLGPLGTIELQLGRVDQALALEQRALDLQTRHAGLNHPVAPGILEALGDVSKKKGDLRSAIADYRRALAIREHLMGPDNVEVGESLVKLGSALGEAHQTKEATSLLTRAVALRQRESEAHPADLAEAQFALARTLGRLGQESRRLAETAGATYERLGKLYSVERAEIDAWLALGDPNK
jgi:eukaryotic-like serine/threonine-protein kinase